MFFSKAKSGNPKDLTADVQEIVVRADNALALQEAPLIPRLKGLDAGLRVLASRAPTASLVNVAISLSAVTTATAEVFNAGAAADDPTITSKAFAAINFGVSGITQLYDLYAHNQRIQSMQKLLIKALDPEYIVECMHKSADRIFELERPYTAETISGFIRKHGTAIIKMESPDTSFELSDNSFCTWKNIGSTAGATGLSAGSAALFVTYHMLAKALGITDEEEARLHIAAMITSSIPFVKLLDSLVTLCNDQEKILFEAAMLIARNVYEKRGKLHDLPEELLTIFDRYVGEESMIENRKLVRECVKAIKEDTESQQTVVKRLPLRNEAY